MSQKETVLKVFVASPNNVLDERNMLSEVIDEVNSVLAKFRRVRLDLIRYEQETSPDFGDDAQAVINRQIPQDYDIFIGIIWHRVGSRTKRAESGTIEEYQLAKTRYDKDSDSVRLMLYFKNSSPSFLEDIDPQQLKQVQAFRARVENEGALYATFATTDDFVKKIRKDLMKLVLDWDVEPNWPADSSLSKADAMDQSFEQCEDEEEPDDKGLIDLEEIIAEEIGSLQTVMESINSSILEIDQSTQGRTTALNALVQKSANTGLDKNRQKMRAELKQIILEASRDMDRFVGKFDKDVPLFKRHWYGALSTLKKAVPIYKEFQDDRTDLKKNLTMLLGSQREMLVSMRKFREAVVGLPSLSTPLIRAKNKMGQSLQEIINVMEAGVDSLDEIVSLLSDNN